MVSNKVRVYPGKQNGAWNILYNYQADFRDCGDATAFRKECSEIVTAMKSVVKGFFCTEKSPKKEGLQVVQFTGVHAEDNCRCCAALIAARIGGRVVE